MFASSAMAPISKRNWLLGLLLGLLAAGPSHGEEEAISWLESMADAAHSLSYVGSFVYQQGDTLQTMRIIRSIDEEGEHERLVATSGQNREVIRARDRVTCILPEDSSIVVEQANTPRPFTAIPIERLAFLSEFYAISMGGTARIAGMQAQQIDIIPNDAFRYGQRLWLEQDSRLLLGSEVFDEQGEVLEKLIFTSLEVLEHIPAEMLQPQVNERDQVLELERASMPRRSAERSPADWQANDIPPGFQQKVQRRHFLPNKFYQVEHHVYSDGMASVSVFIEQYDDEDKVAPGASRIGGVNVFSQLTQGYLITVLGEVPAVTVRRIAESMVKVSDD